MKNTLNDEKVKDKFTEEDKTTIEDTSKEGLQWLEKLLKSKFQAEATVWLARLGPQNNFRIDLKGQTGDPTKLLKKAMEWSDSSLP